MRRSLVAVVALLALLGGACGDDDGDEGGGDGGDGGGEGAGALSAEEQEYADAWATTLSDSDEDDESGFSFPAEEAQCMGEAMMAELGTAPFDDADIAPADINQEGEDDSPGELLGAGVITDEQADAILTEWDGCTDLNAAFIDVVAADTELDAAARRCISEGLDEDDLVHEGFRASLTSDSSEPPEEVISAIVRLMGTCGGDESGMGGVLVDSIAESLASDGRLTPEQSQCMAQEIVDAIGIDRLIELGVDGGEFGAAAPEVQQEMAGAVLGAAETCEVPLSTLGG
jgi:hypothetical protein